MFLISRLVPWEAQPEAVVLALTGLPVPWPEILGRPDEGSVDLLAGSYAATAADGLELAGLSGGSAAGAR